MLHKGYAIVVHSGLLGWYCRYWPLDKVDQASGIPMMEYQTPVGREDRQLAIRDAFGAIDHIIRSESQPTPDPLARSFDHLFNGQVDEGSALAIYDIAQSLRRLADIADPGQPSGQGAPWLNPPPGAVLIAKLLDDIALAITGMESHKLANDLAFQVGSYKALITAAIVPKLREILESLK